MLGKQIENKLREGTYEQQIIFNATDMFQLLKWQTPYEVIIKKNEFAKLFHHHLLSNLFTKNPLKIMLKNMTYITGSDSQ